MARLTRSCGRSTHYSNKLYDFGFTISRMSISTVRMSKDVYVSSFFPVTARLWNSLPAKCFPLTYDLNKTLKKNNFMAPFYGWGSTTSRLEPLQGGSLLFTTKFPEIPGFNCRAEKPFFLWDLLYQLSYILFIIFFFFL